MKPPIWYKEDEIRSWLAKNRFWLKGTDEQVSFITKHLQLAFEKGYQIGEQDATPCPYPIPGDDGTKEDCVRKGHCGCGGKDADSSKS